MKKFLLGVVLSVMFVANSALAMTFSQPVEIGSFVKMQAGHGKFEIHNATYNSDQAKIAPRSGSTYYTNGVARFGDGEEAIWLHYNSESRPAYGKLGGKNFSNVLDENFLGALYEIFYIGGENGYKFYAIRSGFDIPSAQLRYEYDIIGRKPDGTWVKYLNTNTFSNKYIGKNYVCSIQNVFASSNAIVMQYKVLEYKFTRLADGERGEFRFTWDEAAHRFSVDHIVY